MAGRSRTPRRRGAQRPPHVVIATRLYAPEPVAAAFRLEALVLALERAGAEVTVLTSTVPGAGAARSRSRRVSRWPVRRDAQGQVRGYLSYLSFDVPLALRLLLQRRMDALVIEPPPTTGLVGMVAAALRRVPYTFYAADVWSDATDSVEGVPTAVRSLVRWAETTVWRRAARVLTISPGVQHRLEELIGARDSLVMVGNGIDTETFTERGPDGDEEGPYFVYAGTVSEWQGAEVFLDAFATVRRDHPTARLLFFSEGSGRDALEARARAEGLEGIEFRAKIPAAQVAAQLRGAVAGLSSITPGQGYEFALPTKIYAATATGTPVIHAGEGAAHDRIRDHGLGWACDHDAAQVAAAMDRALRGDGRPAAAAVRQWTVENASLAGCAARGAEAILQTLPGRR
ncbi:glycosyltransferase [Brachybacterium saurashtrense]|uniref:D-inositol 3-phosphate glycosyltransferase n=1 Tax=Brachybacterium saurashtrense TaxID=556288 RepID=A0A345YNP1_9MICO|nr:glycosyltransferase [Brachybacterium saurashtrense]AXK45543.1 glycosyltransferase [Brachybacterium saurashtrense]RRR21086.1 glycosyltransferase [Brachybacterium saurashtrense]